MENFFVFHLTFVMFAGLLAGWICKKFKASALIGYLVVGTLIGPGGFDFFGTRELEEALKEKKVQSQPRVEVKTIIVDVEKATGDEYALDREFENVDVAEKATEAAASAALERAKNRGEEPHIKGVESADASAEELEEAVRNDEFAMGVTTEFGVLLLLFAIGIEFTFDKLASTARYMFVGGALQMGLTVVLSILINRLTGMTWAVSATLGFVVALSSTALVYRSMQDVGQADTKRGQATLGLLIFQDVALVPLLLLTPRLFGTGTEDVSHYWFGNSWIDMGLKSFAFCALVVLTKITIAKLLVGRLAAMRSNDLVILFAIVVLLGMCSAAQLLGLTPALGALAAGLALGENRLTRQINALVLPFREAFSALFFISLGMLMDFSFVFSHPALCFGALLGAIALKCVCAAVALRACGMDWRGSFAFGLSISQVGELAFMLLAVAFASGAVEETTYQTMLFVSVGSLVITPNMVKLSLTKLFGMKPEAIESGKADAAIDPKLLDAINSNSGHAIVVGVGHIGGRLAEELTSIGKSVCLVDFNPVNLHPFAQLGYATVAGDGANFDVLQNAGIGRAELILVTVPRDDLALNVVRSCQQLNPTAVILARARYRLNIQPLRRAGAELVLCEENNLCDSLLKLLDDYYSGANKIDLKNVDPDAGTV